MTAIAGATAADGVDISGVGATVALGVCTVFGVFALLGAVGIARGKRA